MHRLSNTGTRSRCDALLFRDSDSDSFRRIIMDYLIITLIILAAVAGIAAYIEFTHHKATVLAELNILKGKVTKHTTAHDFLRNLDL